jgi:hypothetical protein
MSGETVRKELTARLESDLYEQLREATYKLRISKQQAITEALTMWLRSNSSNSTEHHSSPDKHIPTDLLPVVNWLVRLWGRKGTPEQESLKNSLKALAAGHETHRKVHSKTAP